MTRLGRCGIYTQWNTTQPKKNDIMPLADTWMERETLILSEVNHKEKDKYHMISLIPGIYNTEQMNVSTEKKIMDLENRLVVAWGEGGREWEGLGTWGK